MNDLLKISVLVFLASCSGKDAKTPKRATHYVQVESVKMTSTEVEGRFQGKSVKRGAGEYLVHAKVPANISQSLREGSPVSVSLPHVNSTLKMGTVYKIDKEDVSVRITNQLHDLADQELEVLIPIKGTKLFEIPISSAYSPMGKDVFVFSVEASEIHKRAVDVIQIGSNSRILVYSNDLSHQSKIVTRGLDNLIEGDIVSSEDVNEL